MEKKTVDLKDIREAPIRHDALPAQTVARIERIKAIFDEVYHLSMPDWLEGFQRDADPEREVLIWEAMGRTYLEMLEEHGKTVEERKHLFSAILLNHMRKGQ